MKLSKVFAVTATLILWVFVAVVFASLGGMALTNVKLYFGLAKVPVPVEGTGSMYPSLYWDVAQGGFDDSNASVLQEERTHPRMYRFPSGFKIGNLSFFHRELDYGDMVTFYNGRTRAILSEEGKDPEAGFIKRVIGLPGDRVTVRDGFVIRNGETIQEPYIYKPRSTYGGASVSDCQEIVIPEGHVFVLGDNRKLSSDSRHELGLVPILDVSFVLPYKEQTVYHSLWRDAAEDSLLANQPTLDKQAFYNLLNAKRSDAGLKPLRANPQLEKSSALRAEVILQTNDLSTEATRSGYTMSRAMSNAGYSNILTGEVITMGFYDAEELLHNLQYFPQTRASILDARYQEIGFSAIEREVNGCPTQAVVGHFGAYLSPDYDDNAVQSWGHLLDNLNSSIPTWEAVKGKPEFIDQDKLNRLLNLMYQRRDAATDIYNTMKANKWLSEEQKRKAEEDDELGRLINELVKELNNR